LLGNFCTSRIRASHRLATLVKWEHVEMRQRADYLLGYIQSNALILPLGCGIG
jgi:hypothetical protein